MNRQKHLIFTLCILAIISASISPACAFISGKAGSWIEICAGMNIQKIKVDTQSEAPDVTQQSCEFCFHNHMAFALTNNPIGLPVFQTHEFASDFVNEVALTRFLTTRHARAPPIFS